MATETEKKVDKAGKSPEKAPPKASTSPDASAKERTAPKTEGTSPDNPAKKKKRPGASPSLGKKKKEARRTLLQKIAKQGALPLEMAISFLKKHKLGKFDETVEIHMSLGIDPRQSDQAVRGSVGLPHGIGKSIRLLVFTKGDNVDKAKEAGADYVGGEELAKQIQGGWLAFDAALATPDMMSVVGRLGKILGPRGLMPTPKAGTVVTGDVATAVTEYKAGKVEYRADSGGNVHAPVGKLSFPDENLAGNITTFVDQIRAAKPSAAKGQYIKSVTVSATMSPGIPVNVQ